VPLFGAGLILGVLVTVWQIVTKNLPAEDVTNQVTWTSSVQSVATISSTGLATGVGRGVTTISAAGVNGAIVGTATLTVINGPSGKVAAAQSHDLTSLTIIPSGHTVHGIGEPAQFVAIGHFTGTPATQDMTLQVSWSSSDAQVATIDSSGLTIGANLGSTTITAVGKSSSEAIIPATATLQELNDGNGTNLPLLAVRKVGAGSGTVTSEPPGIICSSGAACTGNFTPGSTVTLIAAPNQGVFGGWSANCTPVVPDPNSCASELGISSCTCRITLGNNESVGAIFNLSD
jgi:hypothetical protein